MFDPKTSYLSARTLGVYPARRVRLVLVGAGGTGSWVAPQMARLARAVTDTGRQAELVIIDHDRVETKNVGRSNFAYCEVGRYKAETLAARLAAAWGVRVGFAVEKFEPQLLEERETAASTPTTHVVVGCVDNGTARRRLAEVLDPEKTPIARHWSGAGRVPSVYYLDCGNFARDGGQVLLSTTNHAEMMRGSLAHAPFAVELPAPGWQHPELLEDRPEELAGHKLSCAELMQMNAQSLTINSFVASVAGDYLMRLLLTNDLKRFATYFDLPTCTSRSLFITPEQLAHATSCEPSDLTNTPDATRRGRLAA